MSIGFPLLRWMQRIAIAALAALAIAGLVLAPMAPWAVARPAQPILGSGQTRLFTTVIDRDPTDIYLPLTNPKSAVWPVVVFLQGANVDKSNYTHFATRLTQYGFVVIVPNHWRIFPPIPGLGKRILLPDQHQIVQILDYIKLENSNPFSPLFNSINPEKLVVIGHSMGGLAGVDAIQNHCRFPLCLGQFSRPVALVGGVFYGTNLKGHFGATISAIANAGIPISLIHGSLDGESNLEHTQATYQKIQDPPKALVIVTGANHYGITNTDNPINPPGMPPSQADPLAPTLDQDTAIEKIAQVSALFLQAYVLHDQAALTDLHHQVVKESSGIVTWTLSDDRGLNPVGG